MPLTREIRHALEKVVGANFVSDDPVICQAYSPGRSGHLKDLAMETELGQTPVGVVLPTSTEEVQKVVLLCNRYKMPFVPVSSYWITHAGPRTANCLLIDMKRMAHFEIDAKNMYATVGPGVIYGQLQEEAFKRGLYTTVPGGGAQVAVIANHITAGFSPLNYRNGIPNRRILGFEWILPTGELVKMGSLSCSPSYFWGEGPGPDLRGVLKGYVGWQGSLGIVTSMAVKLFPFQTEKLKPVGITPDTALELPTSRIKWYNYQMPDRKSLLEAMYELGNAGIGAAATKVPILWRYLARARSKEEYWNLWNLPGKQEEIDATHILRVLLIGYASQEQLEYEERVLTDIMNEYGGILRRTRQTDESWLKNADAAGMWFMTGGYSSCEVSIDTIDCAVKGGEALAEAKKKFTPPLMVDYGEPGWFQTSEMGHMGYLEFLNYYDPWDDNARKDINRWYYIAVPKEEIKRGMYSAFMVLQSPFNLVAPSYGPNSDKWLMKVKKTMDPNNISNPPFPLEGDLLVERLDYLKKEKDW